MNIQLHSSHIMLGDNQKDYITQKIEHIAVFDKHIDDASSITNVHIKHNGSVKDNKQSIVITVDMKVPHGQFHSSEVGKSPEAAIDKCIKKLEHQINKYKAKHNHLHDASKIPGEVVDESIDKFSDLVEG